MNTSEIVEYTLKLDYEDYTELQNALVSFTGQVDDMITTCYAKSEDIRALQKSYVVIDKISRSLHDQFVIKLRGDKSK